MLLAFIPVAAHLGVLRIQHLYVVAFLIGTLTVEFDYTCLSFLPSVVGRKHLVEGSANTPTSTRAGTSLALGAIRARSEERRAQLRVIPTDTEIRFEALDALRFDVRIDESNIAVDVTSGVVSLYGTVPTYFQKVTAAHDILRIKGVRQVINELEVVPTEIWTDDEIARMARGMLDRDAALANPQRIHGAVAKGVVTLTGVVGSAAEREAAARDAQIVPGAANVINNLTVVPPHARSDADIATEVRRELANDLDIDAAGIDVRVLNGVVFLRGTAPSDYDAHQAQHNTWCVTGVRDVANELVVPAP